VAMEEAEVMMIIVAVEVVATWVCVIDELFPSRDVRRRWIRVYLWFLLVPFWLFYAPSLHLTRQGGSGGYDDYRGGGGYGVSNLLPMFCFDSSFVRSDISTICFLLRLLPFWLL
jgi:hypothetical protein